MVFQQLSDFITEYFVNPINYPDRYPPYNPVNTITFALLAIVAVYCIYKFLNARGITTDEKFYWAVIPFVFFGSIVRVLSDAAVLPRAVEILGITFYPFITPQIYVLIFVITIAVLLLSLRFYGDKWHEPFSKTGRFLAFISILPLLFLFKNFLLFGAILGIVGIVALLLFLSPWKTSSIEKAVVLSQVFDGSATFIGVSYGGYFEQHVVGNFIFDYLGGPFSFLVVKFLFALAVVYSLRTEKISNSETSYVSLLITLFGLAPGTRDALRLLAGV